MDTTNGIVNVSGKCFDYVTVFSDGILNVKHGESILQHSLVRFHVQLLLMFLVANSFHFLLKRFHFLRFTSDILAGIVLGPTVMGNYFGSDYNFLFPRASNQVMASLSKIGYSFFVFFAGVHMDTTLIWKTGSRKAFAIGLLIYVTVFIMELNIEFHFPKDNSLIESTRNGMITQGLLYFGAMIHTEFVGVSYLLMELKIINSQLGRLALASSMHNTVLNLAIGILKGLKNVVLGISIRAGIQACITALAYFMFIGIILKKMVFTFIRRTPEGQPLKEIYATITMAFVLLLSSTGDTVGLNYLFGPLIFGFIVPARSPLAEVLTERFTTAVRGFLLPLMTMFCASKIDLRQFISEFSSLAIFKISLIGFGIKVAVIFIGVLCCKIPLRHAVALTVILNAKGVFEVGNFISYYSLKDVQSTSGVFLLLLLQAFQPLLVKNLYHPAEHYVSYKSKNIEHASDDAELQMLVCAHREEDAMAAITLLEYSSPTKHTPLSIYGLCLEELISSFVPLVIDHQLGQKISSSMGSRSQPIIDIFNYFKTQHKLVHMHVFTAISPFKQMHEDICWLSFDKDCSLIIIPFHKKWNSKGKVVSDNSDMRKLNISILENAPCSVGILIDRKRTQGLPSTFASSTTHRVAALFVGGSDDREALAYALRMARGPRVDLTIIHFVSLTDDVNDWEDMLNKDILRRVKAEMSGNKNIHYIEETVRDGSDTSSIVQSMAGDHDLIMVGRQRETVPKALSGLSEEWIDFPELGPLGDLLASEYISNLASVLVVQQQKKKENFNILD